MEMKNKSVINYQETSFLNETGNILASLPSLEEIERLMECPVCQEIPQPPIYTCETGHTICSNCRMKLHRCPLCKFRYTCSRNFSLESIVLVAKFYCSNRHKGCRVTGSTRMLAEHHEECAFRNMKPMQCYLSGQDGCTVDSLFLPAYVIHLAEQHQLKTVNYAEGKSNVFARSYSLSDCNEANLKLNHAWPNSLFVYDEKVFVTKTFSRGGFFFFKLAVIQDKADNDEKYSCKVTMERAEGRLPKIELTTMVPFIREFEVSEKAKAKVSTSTEHYRKYVSYGAVDAGLLGKLGRLIPDPETGKSKLQWSVRYEVNKS